MACGPRCGESEAVSGRLPIERTAEGDVRVWLSGGERALIREAFAHLHERLQGDLDDPALERLFPLAYENAPEDEAEYRRLTHHELLASRMEALRMVEKTLDEATIDQAQAGVWLGAMNDLRLVLGTELDVTEDALGLPLDRADPKARELALYTYLSWLQELLVEAVSP